MTSTAPSTSAPPPEADALVAVEQPEREHGGGDADREVDEEDPVPAEGLGQHAAGEQPDRAAGRGHEAVDADRLRLLAWLGEHGDDHAQDHRGGQRPADALEEPRAHKHLLALRHSAQQRGEREQRKAGQEDVAAPDQVAEPSGEQQQPAEGDQVGVHHPREGGLREAQIVLDRGQRDVNDRRVEDDHQHPDAQHDERDPAGALRGVRGGGDIRHGQ